jgi:pimeloyl-[acyl-carrier protein] methyl ester esterase
MNLELALKNRGIYRVVILNGWACPKALWADFANAFAGLPCVVMDMDFAEGVGSAQHLELLARQVDEGTLLIGWSLGGMLSIQLLAELERRDKGVAEAWLLMSGPCFTHKHYAPHAMSDQEFDRFAASLESAEAFTKLFTQLVCRGSDSAKGDIKFLRKVFAETSVPGSPVLREGLELLKTLDLSAELRRLGSSINLVFGEQDYLLDISVGRYVESYFKQHHCFILPNFGHFPCGGQKERVLDLIASSAGVAEPERVR